MTLRFGYGTNGFPYHRLDDVLDLLADLGYDGVALTLDHIHFDPYAPGLPRRVGALAARLARLGLSVTVETGAPYLLDPRGMHLPGLASGADSVRRVELLRLAVRIAADLGSPSVHLASGPAPADVPEADAWKRLTEGCEGVLDAAVERGVTLAFEPEPDMFVDVLDRCLELRRRLGDHERFGVTLDVGHAHCVDRLPLEDGIRRVAHCLVNVQIEDMVRGVHRHLELGTGEIDFPPILRTLAEIGHRGLVSVEIQGAAFDAPEVARRSLDFLRTAAASR